MKKILFITPRNPFSGRFSGDVIRADKFSNYLAKKYSVTIASLDKIKNSKKVGKINLVTFKEYNIFFKLVQIFYKIVMLKPMQLGYFYSKEMKTYIENNYSNFDFIFCQSIRAAQYVESVHSKTKTLDMGDLYSSNYFQTFKLKSFFNPIKYIYLLESYLMKKYEKFCFKNFDKIYLFSKQEIRLMNHFKKKIFQLNFGIDKFNKKFKFSKKNNKIIFIGNIKYLPNKEACKHFAKKIFPDIIKINPKIQFHIVGEISKTDKFLFEKNKSIYVHGKIKKLDPIITKSFCGLANLSVSTGIQTKILTYMSYGLPCISSKNVIKNFDAINSSNIPFYKSDSELIKIILKLKNNRKYSEKISKKSLKIVKNFKWDKVLLKLKPA